MGREVVLTITTTPQKVLDTHEGRTEYNLQNKGTVTIFLGFSEDVSSTGTREGRDLAAGVIESANNQRDPALIKKAQWAVVVAGTCKLWIWES